MEKGEHVTEKNYKRYAIPDKYSTMIDNAFPDDSFLATDDVAVLTCSIPYLFFVEDEVKNEHFLLAKGDVAIQKAEQILAILKECDERLEEIVR